MALALASAVHVLAEWQCADEPTTVLWWLSHGAFEAAAALALFKPHATDTLLLQLPTSTLTRDLVSLLKQLLVDGWMGGWMGGQQHRAVQGEQQPVASANARGCHRAFSADCVCVLSPCARVQAHAQGAGWQEVHLLQLPFNCIRCLSLKQPWCVRWRQWANGKET
jgi:hypothetical protein